MGKILPFEQNASFYARRGDVRRMEGKLLLALRMYRRADPTEDANVAYRMEAAAICSEMGCFQQSNALLAGALWRNGGDVPQEYFYNYGCNFAGLHDYAKAMECFSLFIEEESFSEHAAEIYDLLEAVEEEGLSGAFGDELDEETAGLCAGGVSLLSRGKVERALTSWSRPGVGPQTRPMWPATWLSPIPAPRSTARVLRSAAGAGEGRSQPLCQLRAGYALQQHGQSGKGCRAGGAHQTLPPGRLGRRQ